MPLLLLLVAVVAAVVLLRAEGIAVAAASWETAAVAE
jgi:hypothetical protein